MKRLRSTIPRQVIEALEPRRMLAFTVNGTNGPDSIEISFDVDDGVHVKVNGTDHLTSDGLIIVNALGGNDSILTQNTGFNANFEVNGGDGDDSLLNPRRWIFGSYGHGNYTFDGGPGNDVAVADNSADELNNAQYAIAFNTVTYFGSKIFPTLTNVERLEFHDNDGPNRIEFFASPYEQVLISGNGGDDLITNAPTGGFVRQLAPSLATGGMTVLGGGGNDTLTLDDRATSIDLDAVRTCTLTAGTVQAAADEITSGVMSYGGFESFSFAGSRQPDLMQLRSQLALMPVLIETNDGDDTVQCGAGDFDNGAFSLVNTSIIAGNGNDSIEFDDRLDGPGETESYLFDNFKLSKGIFGITYSAFETQTLLAADGGTTPSTVNVNAISGQVEHTTIIGGANRTNTVNIGNGDLVNVSGTVDIQLGAAGGTINFNDQSATTARTYSLTATSLTSPPTTFAGAGAVNFNGGAGADSISVNGSAVGTAVVVHGNGGNDTISIGGGNFDNMLSAVSSSATPASPTLCVSATRLTRTSSPPGSTSAASSREA
jgi:hypothetical protein